MDNIEMLRHAADVMEQDARDNTAMLPPAFSQALANWLRAEANACDPPGQAAEPDMLVPEAVEVARQVLGTGS